MKPTAAQRFEAKTAPLSLLATDCILWVGGTDRDGYGRFTVSGRTVRAHRFAFEEMNGPVPDGLELDHTCRRRECVNPHHLEPVTHHENVRRARLARVGGPR